MRVDHQHPSAVLALNATRRALLALAFLLCAAGPVAAATYYVTTGGSDTNAGTQAAPWRTLAKANSTLAAGDVCMIGAGTYSDPIQPAANGAAGARIGYVGSLGNPASVVVPNIYLTRSYVSVKGVRSSGTCLLYYTNESSKPARDSVAYCNIATNLAFWGAQNCVVARNAINGMVGFLGDHGYAGNPDPWTANSQYDTLRSNTISVGVIPVANKAFVVRCGTQYCVIDSNRISGFFAVANGGDLQGRYIYNSYYNTFRDNSWRFEADGEVGGGGEYTAFALRDSSSYNLFERDTMLCGVQSGYAIGGRLCNSGSAPGQNLCIGNHWNGCFYQTTGWVANLELLNGALIENSVFASNNNPGLWLQANVQNTTIRNCTFYSLNSPALLVGGDLRLGTNQVYNNIFFADSVAACYSGRPVLFHGYGSGFAEDNNVFYARAATAGVTASSQAVYWASSACSPVGAGTAWASASGNDTHSKWGAPLFTDARWASLDPHLLTGSTAIGAAQGGGDAGAYPFVAGGGDVTAPAAVTNLVVVQVNNDYALLTWTAPGDDGATGTAAGYDLRYSTQPINAANFAAATAASTAPAILPAGSSQSYVMTGLAASTTYYFAIKARDEVGNWATISNVASGTTTATDVVPPARITDIR